MPRTRILTIVLAGGAGGRLELLTDHRAKPAVPYGGTHRLIDAPLTMCSGAAIRDVWVVMQNHPASLTEHLANGRPWDLDRTNGGLLELHPAQGTQREGWHTGTADALWRNAPLIRAFDPDVLLLASADAAYQMDFADLAERHLDSGASLTAVTTKLPPGEDASRFGVVKVSGEKVTDYAYKPDEPATDLIATEIFAATAGRFLDVLEELAADGDDDDVQDIGDGLIPRLVEAGEVQDYRHEEYWRDVGTISSYWRGHQELLGPEPQFTLDRGMNPVLTRTVRTGPARLGSSAEVEDALLAPACRVDGRIERSVLGHGVVIEEGAVVIDSVLLPGTVVRRGAHVERAVIDDETVVEEGVRVGGPADTGADRAEGIALIGTCERVHEDLPPGGRLPEKEQDD